MARPIKTDSQYIQQYGCIIAEINAGTPYRTIAALYKVGLSTVQRLAKKGFIVTSAQQSVE